MSYALTVEAHRRLTILRLLAEPPYQANDSVLADAVNAFGLPSARDQVRTSLQWLAEQGLVTVETIGGVQVARGTARGQDVAAGRARVPGVKPPSPAD